MFRERRTRSLFTPSAGRLRGGHRYSTARFLPRSDAAGRRAHVSRRENGRPAVGDESTATNTPTAHTRKSAAAAAAAADEADGVEYAETTTIYDAPCPHE